ncbi:MAG TPA: hypothetical protein VFN30_13825 [Chitinophagaceae bacterium]|nr:hypothetical protein [Chitinophagaceae bacterium]
MKKSILLLLLLAAFTITRAQAPEGFQFGVGVRLGLPLGDFKASHNFGIGGEVQGEVGFAEKFSAIFTSGYSSFSGKTIDFFGTSIKYGSIGYIPILAGVRVYPANNFFIGGQLGYGILTGGGTSEGAFNYQPQIGVNVSNFQFALNFNSLTKDGESTSHLGLTGIYRFGGNSK